MNPSPDLFKERLNFLTTREAEQLLFRSRDTLYEHRDKAGRLLAHHLKTRMASSQITQIENDTGALTSDPTEINEAFETFYSKLYTAV